MRRTLLLTAALLVPIFAGCDRSSETDDPPETTPAPATTSTTSATEPESEPATQAETSTEGHWLRVAPGARNGAQVAQWDRARSAQRELGQTLLGALTKSIGENGVDGSVAFCRTKAPELTASVGKEHGVAIGRTSTKLRNPENSAPAWVKTATEEPPPEPASYAGPDGELGLVAPISTSALCTQCHGTEEAIADGVAEALDKYYPNDQARGFEEGDTRGWFWVEVPPPS